MALTTRKTVHFLQVCPLLRLTVMTAIQQSRRLLNLLNGKLLVTLIGQRHVESMFGVRPFMHEGSLSRCVSACRLLITVVCTGPLEWL